MSAATQRALREFWRRHQLKLYAVSTGLYDELDALIRADQTRICMDELGITGLAAKYDGVVEENARLIRRMEGHHLLGGCPHCRHLGPPRPVPDWLVGLLGVMAGAALLAAILRLYAWWGGTP